jgi:D-alanyl-D-alanine carboxypeptidase (penicillin-binding protein 5/6)
MKKIAPVLILIIALLLSCASPAFASPAVTTKANVSPGKNIQTLAAASATDTPAPAEKNADGLAIPTVGAKNIVLMDLGTGKVIYSRAADTKAAPASLTKIMTVMLAVEAVEAGKVKLTDKVEAYADCRSDLEDDSSTCSIVPGETMTLKDLMYCALVASANEACNIIAEYLAGSIDAFVDEMNAEADKLGCTGTHFANANGMPADDHYTTASDLCLITKAAIAHDLFMTICTTQSYTVPATNKADARVLYNSNALISGKGIYGSGYIYDYAAGVKTGHTAAAGYCLVSTAKKNDVNLLCVVMGCGSTVKSDGSTGFGSFSDTITLYNWAFQNYKYCVIHTVNDLVAEVKVKYAPSGEDTVNLHPEKDISVLAPSTVKAADFQTKTTLYEQEPAAPINAGQALGEMEVSLNGVSCGKTKLLAATSVDMSQGAYMKSHIQSTFSHPVVKIVFWLVILAILMYVALVVRYRVLRQRHLREKRRAEQERMRRREKEAEEKIFAAQPRARMETYDPAARRGPREVKPTGPVTSQSQRDYFDDFFRSEEEKNKGKK